MHLERLVERGQGVEAIGARRPNGKPQIDF